MENYFKIAFLPCLILSVSQIAAQPDLRLKSYGPLASDIYSVSGFSSGGALTFSYYLSHSSELRGAGIFSGLMYECGLGRTLEISRLAQCARFPELGNFDKIVEKIEKNAEAGLFDPLEGLQRTRTYIHHGAPDPIVNIEEGNRINRFFRNKSPESQVYYNVTEGGHGYPTYGCGLRCGEVILPTTNGCLKCGWTGAFESLNYIYGGGLVRPEESAFAACKSRDEFEGLYPFNQAEFFPNGTQLTINMFPKAYVYVPRACEANSSLCTLHVHIHGCGQEASSPLVMTDYIKCSGVTAVAEANNIIVIFPQASFGLLAISNLLQCWDFVGYTGKNYGTKKGPQTRAIKAMVDRVRGPRVPNSGR